MKGWKVGIRDGVRVSSLVFDVVFYKLWACDNFFFNRIETWLSSKRVEDFHDRGFVLVDVQEFPLEGRENAHFTPEIDSEYGIYLRLR